MAFLLSLWLSFVPPPHTRSESFFCCCFQTWNEKRKKKWGPWFDWLTCNLVLLHTHTPLCSCVYTAWKQLPKGTLPNKFTAKYKPKDLEIKIEESEMIRFQPFDRHRPAWLLIHLCWWPTCPRTHTAFLAIFFFFSNTKLARTLNPWWIGVSLFLFLFRVFFFFSSPLCESVVLLRCGAGDSSAAATISQSQTVKKKKRGALDTQDKLGEQKKISNTIYSSCCCCSFFLSTFQTIPSRCDGVCVCVCFI